MIELTPTNAYPLPYDDADEQPVNQAEAVAVAVNTADLVTQLGGSINFTVGDAKAAADLISKNSKGVAHVRNPALAKAASEILKRFDYQSIDNAQQARNFITNKLIELADCGDTKIEIKALELLGKHSDIGIFTDRSEVTIHHTSSATLENSIKDRIKRLLNSDVTDVAPLDDLEAQLGPKPIEMTKISEELPANESENP